MVTPIFFLDFNSPCKDLLFLHSQKPHKNTSLLVGTLQITGIHLIVYFNGQEQKHLASNFRPLIHIAKSVCIFVSDLQFCQSITLCLFSTGLCLVFKKNKAKILSLLSEIQHKTVIHSAIRLFSSALIEFCTSVCCNIDS